MSRSQSGAASRPYHHGDLRNALIGTALKLLETEGVADLSLRRLAREAGVSATAPYAHFADRQAVLAAVAEAGFALLDADLGLAEEAMAEQGPAKQLTALGAAYVGFAIDHPALFRLMFGSTLADLSAVASVQEAGRATYARIDAAVARLRPEAAAGTACWSMMHGLAVLVLDNKLGEDFRARSELVEGSLAYLVAGLTAA